MTDGILYRQADALRPASTPQLDERDGTLEQVLDDRIDVLTEWLEENAPSTDEEKKRLDPGRREQLYWRHGYLIALRSIRAFIAQRRRAMN
jgi:hypothetical protein